MKSNRFTLSRTVASVLLAASFVAFAGPALSQPNPGSSTPAATPQQRWHEHVQTRLRRMAERLKITPAQQAAWTAYTNTVESLIGTKLTRPAADADAASIARFRADLAAERAQKLSQLADATATLQQALDPEQQKTLNELTRHKGRRAHHKGSRGL